VTTVEKVGAGEAGDAGAVKSADAKVYCTFSANG
jgi:hypothetical protein